MKHKTNKLLSLLLVFVMMLSFVPTAMAAGNTTTHTHDPNAEWKFGPAGHWHVCPLGDNCSLTIGGRYGDAGHDFGAWNIDKKATCTVAGQRSRVCSVCSYKQVETLSALSTTGHQKPASAADYTQRTNEHLYLCDRCNEIQSEAHSFTNDVCACGYAQPTGAVTGVTMSPTTLSLNPGNTAQLTATVEPATATVKTVTWSSNNSSVARVSTAGGLVTAVAPGTAIITATSTSDATKYASCTVTVSASGLTLNQNTVSLAPSQTYTLSVTSSNATGTVTWTSSNNDLVSVTSSSNGSCTVKAASAISGTGYATITARDQAGKTGTCTVTVSNTGFTVTVAKDSPSSSPVYLGYNYYNDGYYYPDYYYPDYYYPDYYPDYYYSSRTFSVRPSAYLGSTSNTLTASQLTGGGFVYRWELRQNSSTGTLVRSGDNSTFTVYASDIRSSSSYVLTCTVAGTYGGVTKQASTSWTIYWGTDYTRDFSVSATVYDTSSGYTLDSRDDKGNSSIISQIANQIGSANYIQYVSFSNVSSTYGSLNASTSSSYYYNTSYQSGRYDLRDVVFTPAQVGRTGTASFDCYVYTSTGRTYRCTINIRVEAGTATGGNINYSASSGENVNMRASDFRNWWTDRYSRGTLDYVRFTSVSTGNLYANYSSSSSFNVVSNNTSCYYSPSGSRTGIGDVTYVPSSSPSSVTIRFTAYGTTTSSSTSTGSVSGTVTITYSGGTASTITYSTTGAKAISLNPSDFTSRYRDVVGSSPSSLTIRFRSVPSNGTLAYNSTTLTSSNISNYDFSSSSSGSYRISDVTYTPRNAATSSSDTVTYACYTGSTLRFTGSITFSNKAETIPSGVTVSYSTTGASVSFNAADFYNKNSAMLSASYLVFGIPSSGTLNVGSTAVASGTKFGYVVDTSKGYQNLGSVSYRPAAGFNGTATISFTAYNANGTQAATGYVSILVSQPTATTPTTPAATAKTFKDVPATAWYYSDVAALSAAGIVSGDNNGNFRPADAVTYGEALKLVLLAAGYPQQTELSGASWAQNYLTLAITNSILSGSAGDYTLSKAIDRNAMASVAAKALKLTPVTNGTSPYADTNDSYVLALTNAGIVQGDASSGVQKWRGTDTLTRAEMSRIVYNIYKYRNVSPSGTGTGTTTTTGIDTNKPDWLK